LELEFNAAELVAEPVADAMCNRREDIYKHVIDNLKIVEIRFNAVGLVMGVICNRRGTS
jgi:hypothetical protein